jgi:hypothetical protein
MTEADARTLLRNWPGLGGIEAWMAEQPWEATPGGWSVDGVLQGWRFRLALVGDGLEIIAGEPGVTPARWVVTGRAL